uniref:Uncharacterized protein n=1 Tax=Avena sativa TaxID=4498 RepID=A0ACD5UDA6_AVESA
MEREDIDYSLRAWLKALAILEHLVEPDHCRIILINLHIFLAFNSASKIEDAIPYGVKVIALYKSRMQKLKVAKEALLSDKGDNASAAEVDSENSFLDILTSIFTVLEKKLEDLAQAMLTPISKASGVHNVGYAVPGAASLTSQIAGPSNSMCRAATIETPNLGTACHAWNNLISSRSLLNLVARNFA